MHVRKYIITALCAFGVAVSTPVWADSAKLRPDAPSRYVVKNGDTLWRIAGKYLYSPWNWPKLWGANRSQIRNPQRIYPGQTLVLKYVNGQPRLSVEGDIPTVKLTPKIHDLSSGYGINTLDADVYRSFMQHPQVIDQLETQHAPKLVAGPEDRILFTQGDRVYTDAQLEPGRYLVYRATQDLIDPETKKYLGQQVMIGGEVVTIPTRNSALQQRSAGDAASLPSNEYYTRLHPLVKVPTEGAQTLLVTSAISEIRVGDRLLKAPNDDDIAHIMPHAPEKAVRARIISIIDGVQEAGAYQTITLNKGTADGVDNGTVLSIYRKSRQMKSELSGNRATLKYVSIPTEEIALAMVYRSSEHLSSAIILEAVRNVNLSDEVMNPGMDIDNIAQDSEHSPNTPQDPHEAPYHQYDPNTNIHIN